MQIYRVRTRLVGSGSGHCVRVEWHIYPLVVVSLNLHYKHPSQRIGLVQSGHGQHFIEYNSLSPWYNRQIYHLVSNNNRSLTDSNMNGFHNVIQWVKLCFSLICLSCKLVIHVVLIQVCGRFSKINIDKSIHIGVIPNCRSFLTLLASQTPITYRGGSRISS